jgi:hypothetical protein
VKERPTMAQTTARSPDSNRPYAAADAPQLRTYRAELPVDVLDSEGELLDWVIGYAFDTLDAAQLTLRITVGAGVPGRLAGVL